MTRLRTEHNCLTAAVEGESDLPPSVPTLRRYLSDPAYRAAMDAEQATQRAVINAHFDRIRDADLARRDAREIGI